MAHGAEEAEADAGLKPFTDMAFPDMVDDALPFAAIQTRPYMSFWSAFLMSELMEDRATSRYVYFGTKAVQLLGVDLTGKTLEEGPIGPSFADAYAMNVAVARDRQVRYSGGRFQWEEWQQGIWHAVSLPVAKESGQVLCLTYFVTDRL